VNSDPGRTTALPGLLIFLSVLAVFFASALQLKARVRRTGASTGKPDYSSLRARKRSNYPARWCGLFCYFVVQHERGTRNALSFRAEGRVRGALSFRAERGICFCCNKSKPAGPHGLPSHGLLNHGLLNHGLLNRAPIR
jgi:hypothetical protein